MIIRRGPVGEKQRFIPWSELNCMDNVYKTFLTVAEDTLDLVLLLSSALQHLQRTGFI